MKQALQELEQILTKYAHFAQASVVAKARDLEGRDAAAFGQLIGGVEMWGGAGAVWEIVLEPGSHSWSEVQDDHRRFQRAVIHVADEMDARGLGTDRSREIARVLRKWLSQDLAPAPPYERPNRLPDIEAEIEFLSTDAGGREGPARSGYRPPHDFGLADGLSDAQHEYPDGHWVFPGQRARALLWFLLPDKHAGRLFRGFEFTVQEGPRVVAHGKILRVLNDRLGRGV